MDKQANRENPTSPSERMTMNEQLMYKLAALDAAVQLGFRRLDEKMDRFQTDLRDSQLTTNDRINDLDKEFSNKIEVKRERIDQLVRERDIRNAATDLRFVSLETWQKVAIAKVGAAVSVLSLVWVLIGPVIRNVLGIANQ